MPTLTRRPEAVTPRVLSEEAWRRRCSEHSAAVDELTGDHLDRRRRREAHPVKDFLFTYYRTSVGTLRRWHPGTGVLLEGAHRTERARWRHYVRATVDGRTGLVVDPASIRTRAGRRIDRQERILRATLSRPGLTGCFGLHEWAMLYRTTPEQVRHSSVPLRLSHAEIDEVVDTSTLRCTHFDAYRFFTPEAEPRNHRELSRDAEADNEQPACLHAGMDLYRAATELEAACPGELLLDCLRSAFTAREIDMRSSPYDLSDWGLDPIPVENLEGRAEFAGFQREWIRTTNELRRRLLDEIDALPG